MGLRDELRKDILERYDKKEYWDKDIINNYTAKDSILMLEKEFIEEHSYRTIDVEFHCGEITFDDVDDLAEHLELGLEVISSDGVAYGYEVGIYNQYVIIDGTDMAPIAEWPECGDKIPFKIIGKSKFNT